MSARILVVDDDAALAEMIGIVLRAEDWDVSFCADGTGALEAFRRARPDLVLLDVTMAGMDGLEVLGQLRAMDHEARVVMVTADVQTSTRTLAGAGGAVGFVSKPLTSRTVLQAVDAALAVRGGAQ